jgi:hypothetical protein
MYFKVIFLMGQFVKEFCCQEMWNFLRIVCMFYSLLAVEVILAISQNFVITQLNFVVFLGTILYNIKLQFLLKMCACGGGERKSCTILKKLKKFNTI